MKLTLDRTILILLVNASRGTNGCNYWLYDEDVGFCSALDSCSQSTFLYTCDDDCLHGEPGCPTVCGEERRCIGSLVRNTFPLISLLLSN